MHKHGHYCTTRRLPNGGYGIHVETWCNGEWIETDNNTTPHLSRARAYRAAWNAAEAQATRDNLPVKPFLGFRPSIQR